MGLSKEQVTKINITMGKINDIIKNTLPMLEEYYFDDTDRIDEFKEILAV